MDGLHAGAAHWAKSRQEKVRKPEMCMHLFRCTVHLIRRVWQHSYRHLKRPKYLKWTFLFILFIHWQSCLNVYKFVLMSETPCLHFNSQPLSMFAVQFLNGIGDLLDLIPVLKRRSNSSSDSFRMPGMSHCSALIKVRGKMIPSPHDCNHIFWIGTKCNRNLPINIPCHGVSIALFWVFRAACVGNCIRQQPLVVCFCPFYLQMLPGYENLLLGHSSWYSYAASMRIYKHWDLKNKHNGTSRLSFSSYPGIYRQMYVFYNSN